MGWFKKKPDPISERARSLDAQIVELEAKIHQLAALHSPAPAVRALRQSPVKPPSSQPRLRSTTLPHGHAVPANPFASPVTEDPIFEELEQEQIKAPPESATPDHYNELGVRKYDLAAFLQRLKNQFRGASTSNPKLVNYLAAGSIQGLRPLRYEKRVARNRFLLLVIFLVAVLWGLLWIYLRRK